MSVNEKPQPSDWGNRKLSRVERKQAQDGPPVKDHENRRNAAACFRNKKKVEDWHADFSGCLVTEALPAGTPCWVNIYVKTDKKGRKFLSVVLKPQASGKEKTR